MDPSAFFKVECTTSRCCRPDAKSCPCREHDRDNRTIRASFSRDNGRHINLPTSCGTGQCAWGGALRKMTACGNDAPFRNSREDASGVGYIGREIPVGFASYVSPTINRYDYKYYSLAGWRVAVPRITQDSVISDLLYRIYYYGPQSAGYVRIGDTLVPASLGPGERLAIAENTVNSNRVQPLTY